MFIVKLDKGEGSWSVRHGIVSLDQMDVLYVSITLEAITQGGLCRQVWIQLSYKHRLLFDLTLAR